MRRLSPRMTPAGLTEFGGWSRMAVSINGFAVTELGKPLLGESRPSRVVAEVSFSLSRFSDVIRREWDALRPHDVMFLVNLEAHEGSAQPFNAKQLGFREHYGVSVVRGCEVLSVLGADGQPLMDNGMARQQGQQGHRGGDLRTIRLLLDTSQYRADIDGVNNGGPDMYASFNALVRRRPKENNFKAVLDTIRGLMTTRAEIPAWLNNVFLGYGAPSSASYPALRESWTEEERRAPMDYRDTFLDAAHVVESFPNDDVVFDREGDLPPYSVRSNRLYFNGEC